jgi:hypothetical protein
VIISRSLGLWACGKDAARTPETDSAEGKFGIGDSDDDRVGARSAIAIEWRLLLCGGISISQC